LLPPNWKDFQNTDAGKSIAEIMANINSGGIANLVDKSGKLDIAKFKLKDPEGYKKWKEATDEYNAKIGKAGLDRGGAVDYNLSKDYIDNAASFTEDLLKKAIASGEISREAGEGVYDLWADFGKLKTGEKQFSYDQIAKLQQKLIEFLPRKIVEENSDMINQYIADNKDYLAPAFEGDSDLGDFDWLQNILDGKTAEGEIDADLIKEKKIKPDTKKKPAVAPKYRWRATWGNEEEKFEKSAEEVERRNLVIEVQRLREDVDTTNKLVQSRLMTEDMRFSNTFAMPPPPAFRNRALPNSFKQEHRAIFNPVYAPAMREPSRNMRDEASYQQYKNWYPRVPETTARVEQLKDALIYPSNADMASGGEELYVAPPRDFNYIQNARFTRY
jgi:hypothetical protein